MLLIASTQSPDRHAETLDRSIRVGNLLVRWSLDPGEREFVYDRFVILADTIVDDTRTTVLEKVMGDIAARLSAGLPMPLFPLGAFFFVVLDKHTGAVELYRDPTGIKTGYYCSSANAVFVSTCVHDLARAAGVCEFDEEAVHQILYLQYLVDGATYYQSVHEVTMGGHLRVNPDCDTTTEPFFDLDLALEDNRLSFDENRQLLREHIDAAHRKYASQRNVVLLSGGLDSSVMLASLSDIASQGSLEAVSFKVGGTEEDETVYARAASEHLGTSLTIVEVDPARVGSLDDFTATILRMNNPYYGVFLFGRLPEPDLSTTYFAGQDTRLHTPDINLVDKLAINAHLNRRRRCSRWILRVLSAALKLSCLFGSASERARRRRFVRRIRETADFRAYILKYIFGCDPAWLRSIGVPMHHWDRVLAALEIDLDRIDNPRRLYNEIVRVKYREQYTDQIRYIQSLARLCGTYIALPFHDVDLAAFCSSIPFDQATRFTIGRQGYSLRRTVITKLLLRRAFRDKLSGRVYFRKKAVSSSLHILFNSSLGGHVKAVFDQDLADDQSFLRQYGLEKLVQPFRGGRVWRKEDEKYLYRVYYAAALCVYNQHILNPNRRRAAIGMNVS